MEIENEEISLYDWIEAGKKALAEKAHPRCKETGKKLMQVSFSGGRTSGYMTKMLMDNYSDEYAFIITFANTSMEDERTLEFVNNCDKYFGFNTVWLEGVVHHGERRSSSHKIVNFETASRNGEPFENYISKYGVPNTAFPQCTRELKVNPMQSYLKSLGIHYKTLPTAIGIREDEKRRVAKAAGVENILYPLIDWFPTDKVDVLNWWSEQSFDLGIEEFEGNCKGCFKKSYKKLFMHIDKTPEVFEFHRKMERLYKDVGPQDGSRVFFRGNRSTDDVFALYEATKAGNVGGRPADIYENSGCSESCEVYPMQGEMFEGSTEIEN